MAITPEMHEKIASARNRITVFTKLGSEMHSELDHYLDGPVPEEFDPRVVTAFDNGAETPDEMRDYIRSFYRRNDSDRERYIDPIFQDLSSYRQNFSMTDMDQAEGSLDQLYDYYQKFSCSENLIRLNKDYFDSQCPPAQARAIAANQELFSSTRPILTYLLDTNDLSSAMDDNRGYKISYSRPNAFLSAQSADFIYHQTMDSLEGRSPSDTLSLRIPEGIHKQIFFMEEPLKKFETETPIYSPCRSPEIAATFDSIFKHSFGPKSLQGKEQAKLGKDIFDMIYIDGKSARETVKTKYESISPADQKHLMMAEVLNAMTSGKNIIDLATIQRDQNNRVSLMVNRVQPDLSKSQPTIREDYSRARRMFNWGPFKCKTREDKLKATLAADTGRESRHDQISSQFQKDINELMVREEQEAKKEAPAATLDPVDKTYFGKSARPMEQSKDPRPLRNPRDAVSSKDLMAEERRSAKSRTSPSRETRSPEPARREAKERETKDKGFSR